MMNILIVHLNRLGNALIQLRNAIHVGLFYNYNVILPKHNLLNTTYIVLNKNIGPEADKMTDYHHFFYRDRIENIDKTLFQINHNRVREIMKEIFVIKDISPLGSSDLVIHIRSGDLFIGNRPHPNYLSPPLSFYTDILNTNTYENIYMIAEDRGNPCIDRLLELYPNIVFKVQTLREDIAIILGATNIIMSIGTFIPQLLELSDNIKMVYKANYSHGITSCETRVTDLRDYAKIMLPWKNTPEQRATMLTYRRIPECPAAMECT